jgi:hypothetical protein
MHHPAAPLALVLAAIALLSACRPTPPPSPTVAEAMPAILRKIENLELPAAYVALKELSREHPNDPDVKRLLADLTPVLAALVPDATGPSSGPSDPSPPGTRPALRFAELPALAQTQFTLFAKQSRAPDVLPALLQQIKAFCREHPDFPGGWLLQARVALALQRPLEGTYAAQNLLALGVTRSTEPSIIATMSALEDAGWLPRP